MPLKYDNWIWQTVSLVLSLVPTDYETTILIDSFLDAPETCKNMRYLDFDSTRNVLDIRYTTYIED